MSILYELGLRLDISHPVRIPHMPGSINQLLWLISRPVAGGCKLGMVAQVEPDICAAVHKRQAICRKVQRAVLIPARNVRRRRDAVVLAIGEGPAAHGLRIAGADHAR